MFASRRLQSHGADETAAPGTPVEQFFNIRLVLLSGEIFKELTMHGSAQLREVTQSIFDAEPMAGRPRLFLGTEQLSDNTSLCSLMLPRPPEWAELQLVRGGSTHTFEKNQSDVIVTEHERPLKLMLMGNAGVGKTSLLLRFTEGIFVHTYTATIGIDFTIQHLLVDSSRRLKLQVWDSASGKERFRTVTSAFYRGAEAFLLVFDVTERDSFESASRWIREARQHSKDGDNAVIAVAGNKVDAVGRREVSFEEASEFAAAEGVRYFETSAKDDICVDDAFFDAVGRALDWRHAHAPPQQHAPSPSAPPPKRGMCIVA